MKSGSRRTTTLYEKLLGVLYSRFLLMRTGILMLPKLLDFVQIKIKTKRGGSRDNLNFNPNIHKTVLMQLSHKMFKIAG
ncbi:unnamed protein product [Larinioides sclopetarius]|uniref:Uncharacterized protein n=2 Tax=Larinioides sclopetarius TaxID=280406 RepID=A0AAV2A332_9ARAC